MIFFERKYFVYAFRSFQKKHINFQYFKLLFLFSKFSPHIDVMSRFFFSSENIKTHLHAFLFFPKLKNVSQSAMKTENSLESTYTANTTRRKTLKEKDYVSKYWKQIGCLEKKNQIIVHGFFLARTYTLGEKRENKHQHFLYNFQNDICTYCTNMFY